MTKKTLFTVFCLILLILIPFAFLRSQSIKEPLKIGVASMITPLDSVKYYQDIVDYISKKTGRPAVMILKKTYEEMDRLLEKGEVDIAFICSAPYVKDNRKFGLELLVAPQVNGRQFYRSYIIVHKDSNIKTFEDLKGKTFAFVDPKSNTGRLYPEYYLSLRGYTPDRFFQNYIYTYSHNKSVELVAKRVVDGAAVESLVYNYMKKKGSPYIRETKIIRRSDEFGIPPVVVSRDVSMFVKGKLREIFLSMHKDEEGKRILKAMLIDRFVRAKDSDYDSIREMEESVQKFRALRKNIPEKTDTVFFGIIPRDNPRIAYEKYQPLMDYLNEETGRRMELVLKNSYEDTVNALGNGEIDIALLTPLSYLEAHARYSAISLLMSLTEDRKPFYRSVIITRKESTISTLSELKGKSFAFAASMSTAGNLVPRYLLAEAGIHLKDLSNYKNFDYHDTVVKWVLRGKYDAGAVREAVAKKYIPLGLKIIGTSEPIPTGAVVVGPKTSYYIAESVKKALLKLSNSEKHKTILKKLDPDLRGGFIEAKDHNYEGIRKKINDVPNTCGMGCHPKIRL